MRRLAMILLALSVVSAGIALTTRPADAAPPAFANLNPGGAADLREQVPVNVVFLGYDRHDINRGQLLAGLPRAYQDHRLGRHHRQG